jgi:hypothetical protein
VVFDMTDPCRIEGLLVLADWLFLDIDLPADIEKRCIPKAMIDCGLRTFFFD